MSEAQASFLLLFGDVAVIVEVAEEDDEGDAVTKHKCVHGIWEVTVCKKVVTRVQQEHHKLNLRVGGGRNVASDYFTPTHTHCAERMCSPAAGMSGVFSTTGTSACEGRWQPGHSRST